MDPDRYAGRAIKMPDQRLKLVEKFEDSLKQWIQLDDETLVGFERMQPLAVKAGLRIFGPDCLVMIFDKSGQYTSGKIYVPDAYLEDKVQGKMGLLCGMGPLCKGPEFDEWFGGKPPRLGDWVMTSVRDGYTFVVGGIVMKSVEWKYLRLSVFDPSMIV